MTRKEFTSSAEPKCSTRIDGALTRRRILQGLGVSTTLTALGGGVGTASAQTSVTGGGDALQTAIGNADVGDTITVDDSRTYSSITIDVADLTVTVASGETPTVAGPGNPGDSTVAVSIAANGVTFDGFTVRNQDGLLGIKVQPNYDHITISNNTVDGIGPTDNLGVTGIILGGGDHDNIDISNNTVQNLDQEHDDDGGFPTVNGIFADGDSGDLLSNSTIANNVVRNLESDIAPIGILINCDADTVSINGNTVTGLVASHGSDTDDSDEEGEFDTFAQGINITSPGTTDVDIVRNTISDIQSGDGVPDGDDGDFTGTDGGFNPEAVKIDGDASGVTLRRNNLLSAIGVTNADSTELSAKCNWWGNDDGPDVASGNLAAETGDGQSDVVGPVDYEPWLIGPIGENPPCTGGAPSVSNVAASPNPVALDTTTDLMATVDDSDSGGSDIESVEYSLDGGSSWSPMSAQDGTLDSPTVDVQKTLGPYDTPEVLTVCVRATDAEDATSAPVCIDVAVYDPDGGFVTGGGWFDSPEGAYKENESVTGKATFGFVSKYQKGANEPKGNTQFRFNAAGLAFKSDEYDWLVVAGDTAQFKGKGSLKGRSGEYMFKVKATDGDPNGGASEDAFRIKLVEKATDEVVYDTGAKQPLGGGEIIVHEG